MAWNEPGGNKQNGNSGGGNKPNDPWGGNGGNRNDGPPDLEEALKNFQDKISSIFGGKKGGGNSGGTDNSGLLGGILFAVLLLLWGASGVYQLDQQEKAVVLHLGAYKETVGPGIHWNPPIIDRVFVENVTQVRTHTTHGEMLTEDENIVEVELSVQYNIYDVRKYILFIREPEGALQRASDSALRHVVGSSTMNDVLTTGREKIAIDVKQKLIEYLENYDTGIAVSTVNVEKTQPPSEVQAAFDDVIKAREDEQRVQNEAHAYANQVVPVAEGKAKRMMQEAQGYRENIEQRSKGEADRFTKLLNEYKKAPKVTRERLYIDAVQEVMQSSSKVMVDVEGGNNMMYLPLDKLMQGGNESVPGARAVAGSSGLSNSDLDKITNQVLENLKRELSNNAARRGGTR